MINELLLAAKTDIPFEEGQLIIHQPSIEEISYIGQESFYAGCQYLNFSKDVLSPQDKTRLENYNNFEILMTMIKDNNNIEVQKIKINMKLVLLLLFPDYQINFLPLSIRLSKKTDEGEEVHLIDKDNFESFRNIVSKMFCLKGIQKNKKYNPGGPQAQALVKKFEERQKTLAKLKGKDTQQVSIFSKYISILSVGLKKDRNTLIKYSVYQLFNEFQRFRLWQDFDIYLRAKMAGAQDLEEVDNWMGEIHSDIL